MCELLELGLVRPSFVPPPEIRRLRDLTRLRSTQAEERTRAIQRLEKVLQDAGIKLSSVASKTYSVSARAMLEALLGGVSDPVCLAELANPADYDVIVRFDNDAEVLLEDTLRRVCVVSVVNDLIVATRNQRDFEHLKVEVLNPFQTQ